MPAPLRRLLVLLSLTFSGCMAPVNEHALDAGLEEWDDGTADEHGPGGEPGGDGGLVPRQGHLPPLFPWEPAKDGGAGDAGEADAGHADAGETDAGVEDAGVPDAGVTEPPPPAVPVGSTVVFTGDYETGSFAQWRNCQSRVMNSSCSNVDGQFYGMTLVGNGEQRQGQYAARFEVRDGDIPSFGGGERSEVSMSGKAEGITYEGDERWYQFSLKFPEDFPNPVGRWFIVMQWHSASGPPPLALEVNTTGQLQMVNNTGAAPKKIIGEIKRGRWVDYVLHVKFSNDATVGWAEMWEDGQLVVPLHNRRSMNSESNYLKMGIYRDSDETSTQVVYQDGLVITAP